MPTSCWSTICKPIENAVSTMIYAPLMQGQFDALVSLAFNISLGQFRDSDIVRHLNSGDYLAAANGFDLWRKARLHGRVMVVDALVRRRAAEKAMFLDHPSGPPSAPTPMVTPEMDFGATSRRRAARQPRRRRPMTTMNPTRRAADRAPTGDIAEAVRRLAERTQDAIPPSLEIPLPPGATVAPPEELASDAPVEEAARPMKHRAERLSSSRCRALHAAAAPREPSRSDSGRPGARQPHGRRTRLAASSTACRRRSTRTRRRPRSKPKPTAAAAPMPQRVVREGLPDFDQPAERTPRR